MNSTDFWWFLGIIGLAVVFVGLWRNPLQKVMEDTPVMRIVFWVFIIVVIAITIGFLVEVLNYP